MKPLPVLIFLLVLAISAPLFGDDEASWAGNYRPSSEWMREQAAQRSQGPARSSSPQGREMPDIFVSLRSNMTFAVRLPIGDLAGKITIEGVDSAGAIGLSLTVPPPSRGSPAKVLKASYKDGILLLKTPFATIPFERADAEQEGTQ